MGTDLSHLLTDGLSRLGISLTDDQQVKLLSFVDLLIKWNRVYNLTAVRKPQQIITHHLLDSLSVVPYIHGDRIADVGAGAGLPGIPMAILFPDKLFTLIDSNGKKTRFMQQATTELALNNIEVQHIRVEQLQPDELFDTVISRAFASLEKIAKLSCHLCSTTGVILAMKGLYPEQELVEVAKSFEIKAVHRLFVPGLDAERHLIVIKSTNSHKLN